MFATLTARDSSSSMTSSSRDSSSSMTSVSSAWVSSGVLMIMTTTNGENGA